MLTYSLGQWQLSPDELTPFTQHYALNNEGPLGPSSNHENTRPDISFHMSSHTRSLFGRWGLILAVVGLARKT